MYQNKDHTSQKHIVTNSDNIDISDQKSLLKVANKLTNLINKGDNLFLYGEIGVGKTTFVKYFINEFLKLYYLPKTEITSPTFSLLNEYQVKDIRIKHYDLFRINKKEDANSLDIFEKDFKKYYLIST